MDPMAPAEELVKLGVIPSADFADALRPGVEWRELVARRAAESRQQAAINALKGLSASDVKALLEALQ